MCTVKGLSRLPAWRWWTAKDKGELGNSAKTTWCIALVTSNKQVWVADHGLNNRFQLSEKPTSEHIETSNNQMLGLIESWLLGTRPSGPRCMILNCFGDSMRVSAGGFKMTRPRLCPRPCFQLVHRQHRHSCQIFSLLARWLTLSCRVCPALWFQACFFADEWWKLNCSMVHPSFALAASSATRPQSQIGFAVLKRRRPSGLRKSFHVLLRRLIEELL